jgi:hypothetical protein
MDAGLAAVLGAMAGSVATIGAAFATGWSQREGAKIAARVEHRKDRRQPRYDAYREFIDAVSVLRDIPQAPAENIEQRVHEAGARIKEAWLTVSLLGPESVQNVATSIRNKCVDFETTIRATMGTPRSIDIDNFWMNRNRPDDRRMQGRIMMAELMAGRSELDDALQDYISAAQRVLDDDGSAKLA